MCYRQLGLFKAFVIAPYVRLICTPISGLRGVKIDLGGSTHFKGTLFHLLEQYLGLSKKNIFSIILTKKKLLSWGSHATRGST